jgi:hypothetical protein
MISLEQARKILNNPALTDEEVLEIRDGFRSLVEIIFEQWEEEKKAKQYKEN